MPQIPVDAGLVVFLRLPDKGKVKTRLAATLGEEAALEIYKKLVSITLDIVIRSEIPTYLHTISRRMETLVQEWLTHFPLFYHFIRKHSS